ncbi:mannitol ABC transporter permease [Rhodococcus erythropolis]|uniref:Mannitol ABC transporter permease n=2 Tax=Rhodococcus erythropolis TaxID=1833 RepID=A0A6G9CW82_RHOER|nr:mannitol ABC transporter permease [Rhodococcus erythropolis]
MDDAPPVRVEKKISRAEGWRRRGPLLPALIFSIVVTQIPFLFTLYYSTQSWNLVRPGSRHFNGFDNYIEVFKDSQFREVVVNTVIMIVGTVIVSVILGLALALLLDRAFLGRGIVRTLLITPFLITPVAGALLWKTTMFDPVFGIVNFVLQPFGVGQVDWVSKFPLAAVMINLIWQWTPFMMLLILAGLQSMPRDILEAARVDGAKPFAMFRELTLPHLRRFIELGAVLGAIYLVNTFDAVYMMTSGGPRRGQFEPAVLHLPARVPRLRRRSSCGDGCRDSDRDHHRVDTCAPIDLQELHRQRGGGVMTAVETTSVTTDKPVVKKKKSSKFSPWSVVAWIAALGFFFPVFWMVLTAFKTEADAYTDPPKLFFTPTLEQFRAVLDSGLGTTLANSAFATGMSTILVLLLGVPAAFALSLRPVKKTQDVLFFFISTKMLPVVAAIVPLYVIVNDIGLLDNIWALVILYTSMNLPIAVWMMRSFFLEVPGELLEAASMDGASLWTSVREVILPLISPGIAATALICVIFSWNEFFFAVNLTAVQAQTIPVFLVGFITGEGLYWARLSAAATMAALPVILAGWFAQNKLVRGLSFGAIK